MKTKYAYEKSEYSIALHNFINLKLKHKERYENFKRMQEIEEILRKDGDNIQIVVTTVKTSPFQDGVIVASPMTDENRKKHEEAQDEKN